MSSVTHNFFFLSTWIGFLTSVTKYPTRNNLRKEGCILAPGWGNSPRTGMGKQTVPQLCCRRGRHWVYRFHWNQRKRNSAMCNMIFLGPLCFINNDAIHIQGDSSLLSYVTQGTTPQTCPEMCCFADPKTSKVDIED